MLMVLNYPDKIQPKVKSETHHPLIDLNDVQFKKTFGFSKNYVFQIHGMFQSDLTTKSRVVFIDKIYQ